MNRILLLYCSLFMVACVGADVEENRVVLENSIAVFPDSSFFSDLRHIRYEDGYLYMLDVKRRNVVRLDSSLTEMMEYGVGGRGPGELQAPFSFTANGDTVSILDFMNRSLKQYSSAGYIGELSLDVIPNDGRMDISSKKEFLIPLCSDSCQFAAISNKDVRSAGSPKKFKSIKKTEVTNHNHILAYNDNIIVIPTSLPYLQVYDYDGNLLKMINLDCLKFYKKNLAYILSQSDSSKDNISYILNIDAYLCDGLLYVLCSRYGSDYKSDRIVVVDLKDNLVKRVLMMPDSNYGSICSDGNRLYAFNVHNCSIDVFEIPDL